MRTALNWTTILKASACGLLLAGPAWAQARAPQTQPRTSAPAQPAQVQPAPNRPAQTQTAPAQPGQTQQVQPRTTFRPVQPAQGSDQIIAQMLLIDAQGEVQLGRLGEQRSQNEQVRELAQAMVRDHGQTLAELERLAGPLPAAQPARSPAATTAPRERTGQPGATAQPAASATAFNPVTAKRQIAQEYLTWTTEELNKRKGSAFDIAFVGQQIDRHMLALSTDQVLKQYASPQLQQIIAADMQHAEHHLAQARQIMQQLDSERGAQAQPEGEVQQATQPERPATTAPAKGGAAAGSSGAAPRKR